MEFSVESTDRRALWKPLGVHGVVTLREVRRAREAELRRARRDSQLRSKRPAWRGSQSDEDEHEGSGENPEENVRALWFAVFKGAKDRMDAVQRLRRALRHPQASSAFCRIDGACRGLVGLLTTLSHPEMQLEAARCFLEMSLSEEPSVTLGMLSAAPYLITFLGSQSSRLTESCLLVLGNLGTEGEKTLQTLLKQGLVPALCTCLQSWDPTMVEAAAFCLSQVLQGAESLHSVTQVLLKADMLPILLELLRRWSHVPRAKQPHLGVPPIMEVAWCLHYILCSGECTEQLLQLGLVQAVGGAFCVLAKMILSGTILPGAELLILPLARCLGNVAGLDVIRQTTGTQACSVGPGVLAAGAVFCEHFSSRLPFLAKECLWLIRNITECDARAWSVVQHSGLAPRLARLSSHACGVGAMALVVLWNAVRSGGGGIVTQETGMEAVHRGLASPDSAALVPALQLWELLLAGGHKEVMAGPGAEDILGALQLHPEFRVQELSTRLLLLLHEKVLGSRLYLNP